MFPITVTLHDAAQLTAVMAALAHLTGGAPATSTVTVIDTQPAKAEAPGKRSAATTAPSPRTAAAAPSQPAPSADAPEQKAPEATPPAAAASSASAPVTYPDLQKAVLTLHKMDPSAAVPIAKSLGADTFKALPESAWGEALRLVNEAVEARKAA